MSFFTSCVKEFGTDVPEPCFECDPPVLPLPPTPPQPDPNIRNISYRGIKPDDLNGRLPLENPERGYRFEFIMKAIDLRNPYHGIDYSSTFQTHLDSEENNYGNNKIKLAQVYFYLTDYLQGAISNTALLNMQYIFDQCKANGIKIVLRFTYRYNDTCPYETLSDISNHLSQLSSLILQNESVIHVIQAGFVGLWGEWHTSRYDNNLLGKGLIIRWLLNSIPLEKKVQVRETNFKTNAIEQRNGYIDFNATNNFTFTGYGALPSTDQNRIGFHNDYFVLDQGPNAQWDYRWPDQDFYQVKVEGHYTSLDGEMPYDVGEGGFTTIAYATEGGWYAARRMRAHGYTSFSIVHNFNTNITAWKSHLLTPNMFINDGTVVTDDYFYDQNGNIFNRTAFEYIRDHLGYRFQLRSGKIPINTNINSTARL